MCGGAGTRLWPASRPSRPKQFIPLSGNRSLFQETALRVAPLAADGALIIVGGVAHRGAILAQLDEIGLDAQVLLEPEARDSAAAMAAAAAWTLRADPEGVNVFVASDHHIPDYPAFQAAARRAAEAAGSGRIVTLGVRPTEPSSAYGYIAPEGGELSPVLSFVEKPDRASAERYIADGFLWNSGNFIARADTLLSELRAEAPAVEAAVQAALPPQDGEVVGVLGPAFSTAPKISIDYAVMEKTRLASVLAVDFAWSDLGAWDAVAATGEGDTGTHVFEDVEGCIVRACDGVMVAAVGVKNLAIVVEDDAVLVCDLTRSQDVKKVVERLKLTSPRHLDFGDQATEPLATSAGRLADWLRLRALPLWSGLGFGDETFVEALTLQGRVTPLAATPTTLTRLCRAFAQAGAAGWRGPWQPLTKAAFEIFREAMNGTAGVLRDEADLRVARAAAPNATAWIGQELPTLGVAPNDLGLADAARLLEAGLSAPRTVDEAVMATLAASVCGSSTLSARLREAFHEAPLHRDALEAGRQFEWAWLLARYGAARRDKAAVEAARAIYAFARKAVDPRRNLVQDALSADGTVRSRRARLRPQTEWLKAALALAQAGDRADRPLLMADAALAMQAIWRFLTPDGLWFETRLQDDSFIDEPAAAGSLAFILSAFTQIQTSADLVFGAEPAADLG